ncbi:hypothetical protein [Aestuariivirga sp.]|uniref:hypothetical protein n=1 Tax=Aestuariivirga sp. TaxID=2650926 RepID=UPI003593F880
MPVTGLPANDQHNTVARSEMLEASLYSLIIAIENRSAGYGWFSFTVDVCSGINFEQFHPVGRVPLRSPADWAPAS